MVCYYPVKGWYAKSKTALGKRAVVFNPRDAFTDRPVTIPCGRCIGCKLERSRQWAVRCVHESTLHESNSFITLTYDDFHLPRLGSLQVKDFQDFMKRFRFALGKCSGKRIRFFHCGEYGELEGRPHYHAIIFGYDFPDRYFWRTSSSGEKLYRSPFLESLWSIDGQPIGACEIGDVTFKSAAYVARYSLKKITGSMAEAHYRVIDDETGEILGSRTPEYVTMSRRPGIGAGWLKLFQTDVYPKDSLVLNGAKMRPPRFYDNRFELVSPDRMDKIRAKRAREGKLTLDNNTTDRLIVREEVKISQLKQLKRSI